MKLHRLELQGFGPFRDRQTVDFDAFDADGVFLIAGRTGAGKSSILDGICFSLYGTAPRYDGGDRGLRSDHATPTDPTETRLEFSAGGGRWRVTRSPEYERPKARGEGTTTAKATVLLEQHVDGDWVGRAAKSREAGDLLAEIIGLNRDQFQQVILLAQNRFAEFLLAKNDDRQAVLRSLFGSRRYQEYENEFERRRRAAQQSAEADAATLQALLLHAETLVVDNGLDPTDAATAVTEIEQTATQSTTSRLESVRRAVPRARYRADESARRALDVEAAHNASLAAFGERSATRKRQLDRLASRAALAELEVREPGIVADRARLDRAHAAEAMRATIASAERSRRAASQASDAERTALAAWTAAGELGADAAALRLLADEIAGDLAVWASAAALERSLPETEARLRDAESAVTANETAIASAADAASARTGRIAELEPSLAAAESEAPPLGAAKESLGAAELRLEAGREAARLAPGVEAAEAAHLSAVAALERASAGVRILLQRRLDGHAGELATLLIDGEPCVVCGSTSHPHPAVAATELVTDEAIAAAESEVAEANRAVASASARASAARAEHQAAMARGGGESLERLTEAHAEAQRRARAAAEAADAVARSRAELRALRDAEAASAIEKDGLSSRLADALQTRAVLGQEVATSRGVVAAARGSHAAVADRVADARRRRDLARALADALEARALLDAAAVAAETERDLQLRATSFISVAEASAALLDANAQSILAEAIRVHEVALAHERERLFTLETELAGVPDELVDLDEAAAAVAAARESWKDAERSAARDREVAAQLADAAARASSAHEASAQRAVEFELVAGLANALAGRTESRMDLETFVLAAELEEIVTMANLRLDAMSSGRYQLQHTDAVGARRTASGLGLAVLDAYTGQARPPQSLSGGETFLASLALALGLAQVVTARSGGVRLDTLFIDEGFGSLDAETLELAMRTLDELRQGGRTVGLISHVDAMKEQLPAQLFVEATPQGPSVIHQDLRALR